MHNHMSSCNIIEARVAVNKLGGPCYRVFNPRARVIRPRGPAGQFVGSTGADRRWLLFVNSSSGMGLRGVAILC